MKLQTLLDAPLSKIGEGEQQIIFVFPRCPAQFNNDQPNALFCYPDRTFITNWTPLPVREEIFNYYQLRNASHIIKQAKTWKDNYS